MSHWNAKQEYGQKRGKNEKFIISRRKLTRKIGGLLNNKEVKERLKDDVEIAAINILHLLFLKETCKLERGHTDFAQGGIKIIKINSENKIFFITMKWLGLKGDWMEGKTTKSWARQFSKL